MHTDSTYFIGLDLGTTSVKACAFNRAGKMLGESGADYPLLHLEPGAAVQDAAVMVEAAERSLADLVKNTPGTPGGVGLSCPMHSVLLLDKNHSPLGKMITWADVRAQAVMDDFSQEERKKLLRLTGTPAHPMSPMVKLRWLAQKHPGLLREAAFLSDLKSFLVHRWTTDGLLLDEQLASASGMMDIEKGGWSEEATWYIGVPLAERPQIRPARTALHWRTDIASRLGLVDVPLFLGGSDGVLANLGSGLLTPGKVAITVGTSGAVRATHRQARVDPQYGLFNYKLFDDYYVIGGATNNGGKVLEYWQQMLQAHFPDVGSFIDGALAVSSQDSPSFSPYLYGERAPIWDASASATISGLLGHHDHRHLARAVLDGVTDNLVTILRQLEAAVGPATQVEASGGFTRSPEWLKLLAERSEREVVVAETPQASAYGAALIARLGTGDLPNIEVLTT